LPGGGAESLLRREESELVLMMAADSRDFPGSVPSVRALASAEGENFSKSTYKYELIMTGKKF